MDGSVCLSILRVAAEKTFLYRRTEAPPLTKNPSPHLNVLNNVRQLQVKVRRSGVQLRPTTSLKHAPPPTGRNVSRKRNLPMGEGGA